MKRDAGSGPDSEQIRIPKVAEVVGVTLRRRIVTGEYADGEMLPHEGALMVSFDVARTTVRDAFRILETEGLLEVRRGASGGARVRAPGISFVASYAALLLQSERATLHDVHTARAMIEAPAAGMLARQASDGTTADQLRRALAQEAEAEDEVALTQAEFWFHRQVVDLTGNRVLTMMSAVANRLIAQQLARIQQDEPRRRRPRSGFTDAHFAHGRLVALIAAGRDQDAEDFWRVHLEASQEAAMKSTRSANATVNLIP